MRARLGAATLTATGCGTAAASVCAIGLFQIEHLLGGVYSAAAVVCAGLLCLALARALGRMCEVVPSGAGLLAYLSRGLGRRAGLVLVLPYLLLTLVLLGAEATIVGALVHRITALPPLVGALAFLGVAWVVCHAGVRFGYRAETLATASLFLCLTALSGYALASAASSGELVARLLPAAPSVARFVAGVGQALFLFMGFELLTSQVEVAESPRAVGRALFASVIVLAAFYTIVSLGFSCLPRASEPADFWVPQLAFATNTGSRPALQIVVVLTALSSFTSVTGALLAFSRFGAALASQGVLPRSLMRLHPRSLVPRRMLAAILVLASICAVVLSRTGLLAATVLGAATAAALVYAGIARARALPPFRDREGARRPAGLALGGVMLALAVAVVAGAGPDLPTTLVVLALAFAVAIALALRVKTAAAPVRAHGGPEHAR